MIAALLLVAEPATADDVKMLSNLILGMFLIGIVAVRFFIHVVGIEHGEKLDKILKRLPPEEK